MDRIIDHLKLVYVAVVGTRRDSWVGQDARKLWPEIQPYQTGYLKVSPLHEIFYQTGGNPKGKPVMYFHGGPGGECSPRDFRYFSPQKFNIILHDQRGGGRSKPYAEIRENTTENLVEDVEKLRKHLQLELVILFGGSWGSTLALAYAEKYPQNVSGVVLRGVFAATRSEIDHYYHGGAAKFFPEVYREQPGFVPHRLLCGVALHPDAIIPVIRTRKIPFITSIIIVAAGA